MTPEEKKANELIEKVEYTFCDYFSGHDACKEIIIKLAIDKTKETIKLNTKVLEVLKNKLK